MLRVLKLVSHSYWNATLSEDTDRSLKGAAPSGRVIQDSNLCALYVFHVRGAVQSLHDER